MWSKVKGMSCRHVEVGTEHKISATYIYEGVPHCRAERE